MSLMQQAALLWVALVFAPAAAQADPYTNYRCRSGTGFTLIFEKAGTALVMIEGGALRLEDRHPISGIWFSGRGGDVRGNSETVTFKMFDRRPTTCRKVDH